MTTTATTATTEPARPKLGLKKRVVDVAALKASQPTAQPKPTSQPQPAVKPASQSKPHLKPAKPEKEKSAKQLAHEELMKANMEAAAKRRAEKAAAHAAKMAELGRARADQRIRNREAAEEAEKRATAHREAFEVMFKKLTMVGCWKPLAINSDEILLEYARRKIPDITLTSVHRTIERHCGWTRYLEVIAVSAGKPRYNPLNGEIVGEVTEQQAAEAIERLESRRAARKAAKEAARKATN